MVPDAPWRTFEEVGSLDRVARTYGQLGKLSEDRSDLSGALEWAARTFQLAVNHNLPVLPQVKAHLGSLRDKYGAGRIHNVVARLHRRRPARRPGR